eukprot:TRINITY_DN98750_c0_g1_i1.p1 TRINITY_DN98750_c0_g1~~TRINITY_DN98750_c0_g1_i1.p1  ORF type:complete len:349 (-),score=69.71 TRINITY_DN98750_c0_g1_i1:95-1141(-)
MSVPLRHEAIRTCMTQDQRLVLERYMRLQKQEEPQSVDVASVQRHKAKPQLQALEDIFVLPSQEASAGQSEKQRGRGGICKSAIGSKIYGYYVKAGISNLIFCTRIQRELSDALRDHIILNKILDHARSDNNKSFPARVRCAVMLVLGEEGLTDQAFFRSVTVVISAHHWIGRPLWVHCLQLQRALEAWSQHDHARGRALFLGNSVDASYTPLRARQQWLRIRKVFLQLQGEARRPQVEARLQKMETAYCSAHERKSAHFCKLQQQQKTVRAGPTRAKSKSSEALLHRVQRALSAWRRASRAERKQQERATVEERKMAKKRRWDGKESMEDFERRTRAKSDRCSYHRT